jgi:23S rRNA (adenine2503-C2)-methyltransferase
VSVDKFEKILEKYQEFRLKQAKKNLFVDLICDWRDSTTLPRELKEELNKDFPIKIDAEVFNSDDKNTTKAVISLDDGFQIEAVLMRHKGERNTICVSSQVGCPLGCKFCATGKMGFRRNLTSWEIIEQVLFFARLLKEEQKKATNIVFMGMGEPFLNYDRVIRSVKILNDEEGFNLGARSFSVSTAGVVEGIKKLSKEKLQVNLAVSLHAPNDELRSKIMPINRKHPIKDVLSAVDDYIEKTKRRVMFEYVMIKKVNDSDEQARELAKITKKKLYFINLISYNQTGEFQSSSSERVRKFKKILEEEGVSVTQRFSFGQDIKSACGQLASGK